MATDLLLQSYSRVATASLREVAVIPCTGGKQSLTNV